QLCEKIDSELGPMRERYAEFIARPERIEDILQAGAAKARWLSAPLMERVREAVGLRRYVAVPVTSDKAATAKQKGKAARFVSFRDEDGKFRFRLLSGEGVELLASEAFDDPKAAGMAIKALQQPNALQSLAHADGDHLTVKLDNQQVASFPATLADEIQQALESLLA